MHFPVDRDINYFAQLTSERSVRKTSGGQHYRVWELPPGRANEALDCRVYAYGALAGLMHLGLKLNKRVDEVQLTIAEPLAEPKTDAPALALPTGPLARTAPPTEAKSTLRKSLASRLA
jgi:phage terminase large subunit GpA-like protein